MICPALCTTHGIGDSHIPPIFPSHNDIVDQMPVLRAGVHPGCLLQIGRWKTKLGIRKLCLAQVWRSRRPLLLHFPVPCLPSTPSQEVQSCLTLLINSPRIISLSVAGTAEITYLKFLQNLSFVSSVLVMVCVWALIMVANFFTWWSGSLIVGGQANLPPSEVLRV